MWRQSWHAARFSLSFVARLLVLVIFSAFLLRYFITSDIYGTKEPMASYRNVLSMTIDGDEFWIARATEQGLRRKFSREKTGLTSDINDSDKRTCRDFFVTWPGDCIESHSYLDVRMRTLSAQMVVMNSTLTFFTSDLKGCTWDRYAGIRVALYNATDELITGGFSEMLPIIAKWDKTRFTRLSDILRLCLAHRYQMSYLDTDVHFLQLQSHWYERSYVGAQMWSDSKNAIEITNAAFCLPRDILSDMMGFQKSVIMRKKEGTKQKYFYTELGPSMFHHVSNIRHCDFLIYLIQRLLS
jgi:hypothetical protein